MSNSGSDCVGASNEELPESNLDRFLKHTTPVVNVQHFPKSSMNGRRDEDKMYQPYFVLGDLWESFRRSSAYGTGVPLVLNEQCSVVQYYAPSLSAIQLYVESSRPITSISRLMDEKIVFSDKRTSDQYGSSSSRATRSDGSQENSIDSNAQNFNKVFLNEGEFKTPDHIGFEYIEQIPVDRAPLIDLAAQLAANFPMLATYRSCDLTSSSWFSIAWNPICRIPIAQSFQKINSCFLTFHSLSTPLKGMDGDSSNDHDSTLSLPSFGLGVHKFRISDWAQDTVQGMKKVNSLVNSTENWLQRLGVYHDDFVFFKKRAFLQ